MSSTYIRFILGVVFYALFLSLAAQLSLDIGFHVPITGQTLVLLSLAFIMPLGVSTCGLILYYILGLCGLPVFADAASGVSSFVGPSLGYFLGFLIAVILIEQLRTAQKDMGFGKLFTIHVLAHILILTLGSLLLLRYLDIKEAFTQGFKPFVIGLLIKSVVGAFINSIYYNIKSIIK